LDTLAPGGEWLFDDEGGLAGIVQQTYPSFRPQQIPIRKLLLFRTSLGMHNNPEGRSILRPMYRSWHYRKWIARSEAVGIQHSMIGLPTAYVGQTPDRKKIFEDLDDLLGKYYNNELSYLIIPAAKMNTEGQGVLVELMGSPGDKAFDTSKIIERYQAETAVTVLGQFILQGLQSVGSFAMVDVHRDLWNTALQGYAQGVIAETINRYALPKLYKFSTMQFTEMPQIEVSTISAPSLDTVANFLNKLISVGAISPDDIVERFTRGILGVPESV